VVRAEFARVPELPGADAASGSANGADLGASDAGVRAARLAAATGAYVPVSAVLRHRTAEQLTDYLARELLGPVPGMRRRDPGDDSREPLAIVGMACRLPGGVRSPEDLWRMVLAGAEGIGDIPRDRGWDPDAFYDRDRTRSGTFYPRQGGFLDDAAGFDADFFGISPREARAAHPQQRLLMTTAWEALERARIPATRLAGTLTGVFVGEFPTDYGARMHEADSDADGYLMTGTTLSVSSGRLAYHLGLVGPAVTVDTACSSGLTALHTAASALYSDECSLALVGASTVHATPGILVDYSRHGALAEDGRSRAFSANASGFGVAEGAAVVVVTRLSYARELGLPVLAVMRGSAMTQDGASAGLTVPNGPSQELVIRRALRDAGLGTDDVDLIEAHGTGTKVGDPIEAGAILATYGQRPEADDPIYVGSVKTNIGHTLATAGLAGLIKTVMALRNAVVPPTLHAEEPNGSVDWDAGKLHLPRRPQAWPARHRPRRAGVLSYGISGTNAHVILEQAPEDCSPTAASTAPPASASSTPSVPWLVSARSAEALRAQAGALLGHVAEHPELPAADIGWSLATTRSHLVHRAAIVASDRDALLGSLRNLAAGKADPLVVQATAATNPRTVFVFPGQGSQWEKMAEELLVTAPAFAARMRECDTALAPHTGWSLLDVVRQAPGAPELSRVDVVQPVLFAMLVSLAALWQAHGVAPDAVVGHSQGEIAAACVAGALSLEDAAKIVALRSRALRKLAGKGGMATLALGATEAEGALRRWAGRLWVAAANGPRTSVVAGDSAAIEEFVADCDRKQIWVRQVAVDYASHGAHVEALEDELLASLHVQPHPSTIPFYSTVTASPIDTTGMDAAYWYRNLSQPVLFDAAVRRLLDAGHTAFIEVSPHPVLAMGLQETIDDTADSDAATLSTLHRNDGSLGRFHQALAQAHCAGVRVDWETVLATSSPRQVDLPTYAFQERRFWLDHDRRHADASSAGLGETEHPLLAAEVSLADGAGLLLTGSLSLRSMPWLRDHAVRGTVLLPGTALLDYSLYAAAAVGCDRVDELVLEAPLLLDDQSAIRVQVTVRPDGEEQYTVAIHAQPASAELGAPWTRHASARVSGSPDVSTPEQPAAAMTWPPRGAAPVALEGFYDKLIAAGYEYGPAFRNLTELWRGDDALYASVALDEPFQDDAARFMIHPALLDAALHGLVGEQDGQLVLPFAWQGFRLHATGATSLRVELRHMASDTVRLRVTDPHGTPVADADGLILRPITGNALRTSSAAVRDGLLHTSWTPVPAASAGESLTRLAVLAVPSQAATYLGAGTDTCDVTPYDAVRDLRKAIDQGAARPDAIIIDTGGAAEEFQPRQLHAAALACLEQLKDLLADTGLSAIPVVFVTRRAVAAGPGEDIDNLALASVWGMVRTAQTEHPGRFVLLDTDRDPSVRELTATVATAEPQLALRGGTLLRPRLTKVGSSTPPSPSVDGAPPRHGTVLITGGTGTLGSLLARHLVRQHDVRSLLLTSRRGAQAPGAEDLRTELSGLGADVTITACDVSDRDQLQDLLRSIDPELPLTGVVHTAGVLDDATLESLTPRQVTHVLGAKSDAAWHLHELTKDMDLSLFVLYSSIAGHVGTAGQANYAAANTFLDALAQHRRANGLTATAIAWGFWEQASGMTGHLSQADVNRILAWGFAPISDDDGLALFDAAISVGEAVLAASPVHPTALTRTDSAGIPPLLRALAGRPAPRRIQSTTSSGEAITGTQWTDLSAEERQQRLLTLVRGLAATVLGYSDPDQIADDRSLRQLGADSLTSIQLRNQLNKATGLTLPTTVVFSHPTPLGLARYLSNELAANSPSASAPNGGQPAPVDPLGSEQAVDESKRLLGSFRKSVDAGKYKKAFARLRMAADRRPRVTAPDDAPPSDVVTLASGSGDLRVICLPSLLAPADPRQYTALAGHLPDTRQVVGLSLPGYQNDDPLSGNVEQFADQLSEGVLEAAGDDGYLLLGHSSGGWLTHLVTSRLAGRHAPVGTVLLDTGSPHQAKPRIVAELFRIISESPKLAGQLDTDGLSAMGYYFDLFSQWEPEPHTVPTLVIRPAEDIVGAALEWDLADVVSTVPGNHLTMMNQHAASTAAAINSWINSITTAVGAQH
jgi:acyl transferase domain-containing protein/short-subunit dehydrogenase/acyl carrier protein